MAIGTYISIITLNVNELNAPAKRQRLAEWIQKQDPFTFKVIIDKYDSVAIYFIVWGSSLYTLSVFPVERRSFSIC